MTVKIAGKNVKLIVLTETNCDPCPIVASIVKKYAEEKGFEFYEYLKEKDIQAHLKYIKYGVYIPNYKIDLIPEEEKIKIPAVEYLYPTPQVFIEIDSKIFYIWSRDLPPDMFEKDIRSRLDEFLSLDPKEWERKSLEYLVFDLAQGYIVDPIVDVYGTPLSFRDDIIKKAKQFGIPIKKEWIELSEDIRKKLKDYANKLLEAMNEEEEEVIEKAEEEGIL